MTDLPDPPLYSGGPIPGPAPLVAEWDPPESLVRMKRVHPPQPPADEVTGKQWKLTWGERSWTEDDLTGQHASLVALLAGKDSYTLLDPQSGPMALLGLLTAFISLEDTRDPMGVAAELAARPLSELLEALSFEA